MSMVTMLHPSTSSWNLARVAFSATASSGTFRSSWLTRRDVLWIAMLQLLHLSALR